MKNIILTILTSCCAAASPLSAASNNATALTQGEEFYGSSLLVNGTVKKGVLLRVGHGVQARVSYAWHSKKIYLPWVYPVSGLTDGPMLTDPGKTKYTEELALDFVPTDVTAMGLNRLAVAGHTERGKTIVRVYEFDDFLLPAVAVGPGGAQVVPNLHVPVKSVTTVYSEDLNDELFSAIFWNRGKVDELLVFFDTARELHWLNTINGSLTLAANTTGSGGVLSASLLDYPFRAVNDARHTDEGCLYWFYAPEWSSNYSILVFIDSDCDGDLDSVDVVLSGQWGASGYGDASKYPNGVNSAR